ncbi:MAG: transposase family protein, partial [Legionella sp.]
RKFLPYKDGIPVDDTIARVMRKIDTKAFQICFMKWVQSARILFVQFVTDFRGRFQRNDY